jgi:predicted rRNA methylase YqxC with S4 and FtsJ domains
VVQDAHYIDQMMDRLQAMVASQQKHLNASLACRTRGKTGNQEYMVWIT